MSKKSERRKKNAQAHARSISNGDVTEKVRTKRDLRPMVARPFAGVPGECDWVALRELVPAATAPLTLRDPKYADRKVELGTVLPMAVPALVRDDGRVVLAAQTTIPSPDAGRDIAHALLRAMEAEPGTLLDYEAAPASGPTLAEILSDDAPQVTVHEDFSFWVEDLDSQSEDVKLSMQRANETVFPTARLSSVEAAYWCAPGPKAHVRWPMPYDEDALLDALARLSAAGELTLGEDTKFAGQFRAHGLLVPVWDVSIDAHPSEFEKPAEQLLARVEKALAVTDPLNEAERRSRAGIIGRQVTLR
ncbi:hypothetical protein CLV47_101564 [Antricoccus suffuscus]|uniref:DUF5926 domain-containing protein n=1 Tax=Antricoccus suffuscus TaxID=1629062 RepID=A0A2T1A7X0_9ACTN|nr:DUF5926 family protein [Antricoccus suffuscus]PRZ44438.1 hypothetical protein CLV47_101564 [Antricoccus suffuscus]